MKVRQFFRMGEYVSKIVTFIIQCYRVFKNYRFLVMTKYLADFSLMDKH